MSEQDSVWLESLMRSTDNEVMGNLRTREARHLAIRESLKQAFERGAEAAVSREAEGSAGHRYIALPGQSVLTCIVPSCSCEWKGRARATGSEALADWHAHVAAATGAPDCPKCQNNPRGSICLYCRREPVGAASGEAGCQHEWMCDDSGGPPYCAMCLLEKPGEPDLRELLAAVQSDQDDFGPIDRDVFGRRVTALLAALVERVER